MKHLLKLFLEGCIFSFFAALIIGLAVAAYTYCLCKHYDNELKIEQLKSKK
jgi:hypothetical protein